MAGMIGYIRNPRSTGGGASPEPADDVVLRQPDSLAALDRDLGEMRALGVETLIIDGGDGTIREVVSRAVDIWPTGAPRYAIVASGNTNLIARNVGALPRLDPVRAIRHGALREKTIPVLKIERAGAPPLRGFIMGAGAYETATRMAQEEIASRHGLQVALTVLRLVFSRALRAGGTFTVTHDDDAPVREARMLIGLCSLPGKLIFGCEPFWNGGSGPIRWLDIAAYPPALLLAAPFVAFGRPMGWMRRAYRSGSSHKVELTLDQYLVVDGERFAPGENGRVVVTADETATFLSP